MAFLAGPGVQGSSLSHRQVPSRVWYRLTYPYCSFCVNLSRYPLRNNPAPLFGASKPLSGQLLQQQQVQPLALLRSLTLQVDSSTPGLIKVSSMCASLALLWLRQIHPNNPLIISSSSSSSNVFIVLISSDAMQHCAWLAADRLCVPGTAVPTRAAVLRSHSSLSQRSWANCA